MTSPSSLQEQIDQLKQELEAKDDTLFEVSATLAAIQVETQHRVHQVETDAALRIQKSDEALRRAQHEANQAQLQLQLQLQLQHKQRIQSVAMKPQQLNQQSECPDKSIPISHTTTSELLLLNEPRTGSRLARHLLLRSNTQSTVLIANENSHENNIYNFLLQAQHSNLMDSDVVWYILVSESRHKCCHWMKQALHWSPAARSLLREACVGTTIDPRKKSSSSSRIRCPSANLDTIGAAMRDPLWKPNNTRPNSSATTWYSTLHKRTSQQWMRLMIDRFELDVIMALFQDVASDSDSDSIVIPWWEAMQTTLLDHLAACAAAILPPHHRRRRTHWQMITIIITAENPSTDLGQILKLIRLWWHASSAVQSSVLHDTTRGKLTPARSILAILLDILDYQQQHQQQQQQSMESMTCEILCFLRSLCSQPEGVMLVRAQMITTMLDRAPSGIQVLTMHLAKCQIQLPQTTNDNIEVLLNLQQTVIIRVFWIIMRMSQIHYSSISFTSLLEERKQHWLACMHFILVHKMVKEHDIKLVQSMLEELRMDEEELDEYRQNEMKVDHAPNDNQVEST
jgi:hypothetical protein